MAKNLSKLLKPNSIAIIGASRSPDKVGAIVLKNILSSKSSVKVYPVNPNSEEIEGLKCYPDVLSLPELPDLAIISIPAIKVAEVLNQIGEKGIKNVVIFSAGFKEIGEVGKKLEDEILDIANKYKINVLGPNCLGFINNNISLNATFGQTENNYGNLRFISQSGAIAASLFDWCQSMDLGFSEFVTLGNKTVINENDVLEYFKGNDTQYLNTKDEGLSSVNPIGMYLESISDGPNFIKITKEIGKKDPIFIIKPGKNKDAVRAMQSHTGAIAGEDYVFEAAVKEVGISRCVTLEDFFDIARAFSWEDAPKGPKVAIISNAGGPAVISADAVKSAGLTLADFSEETRDRLLQVLPRSASVLNPIDVLGDALADRYTNACETILETDQADALLVILTPQMMTQVTKTAQTISDLSFKYKKPIFCSFIGGKLVSEGEKILNTARIPSFRFPERAISAIGYMWKWEKRRQELSGEIAIVENEQTYGVDDIKNIVKSATEKNLESLDSLQADKLAKLLEIPTPATSAFDNLDEAKKFANKIGWPVVLKLTSPALYHKAKFGGVVTNIWNEDQLEIAWERLNFKIDEYPKVVKKDLHFQIQKEVTSGVEVIVGLKNDPTFGPILLFGAGGELAELVEDRNIKILPVDRKGAQTLVENSKVFKLFQNEPGEPSYALEKLYDLIVKLTKIVPLVPEASDIEINPVMVTHNDVWAVDFKMMFAKKTEVKAATTPKFHTATLVNKTVLAQQFRYFEFETDETFECKPGQYISIKVAPNRINSYSIATGDGEKRFSLLIDISPGGPGSKFFENIKTDDKIAYMGPFGVFTFKKDDGAKKLLFLGTGSGCSPLRSIIDMVLKDPNVNIPIYFYFGLRHSNDIFWKDYFEKLEAEHPNFHFNLVLSKPDENWQGQVGHITEAVKKDIPDASDCSAYLCGNPKMIDKASAILKDSNCPEERIYTEKF